MSELEEVVRRIEAQGLAGFEPVVRAASPRLFRIAVRLLGSAPDAEDAVQEAFMRAYDALSKGQYDERQRMEGWLVTIVTRVALDTLRSRKLRAAEAAAAPELYWTGLGEEQRLALVELSRWLDALPPDQRAAVVLKFVEGMTSAEVAEALGISEGAVEQRIVRARVTLRERMADDE